MEDKLLDSLKPPYIKGLTLLGGDPFEPENQKGLLSFLRRMKKKYPTKDVWAYTGYVLEHDLADGGKCHTKDTNEMLSCIDVLVDGPYIEEEYSILLKFKGSANQRVIDCKKYVDTGEIATLM